MRLLFIDDNEDDALLAVAALKRAGFSFEPRVLSSIEQLEPALREGTWDAVISDYNLGGATGLDVLRLVRKEIAADIPFLLVSGTIGDERSAEAIRAGVHDYISKDRLARLPGALQRELDAARDRDARRALEASLAEAQERYRQTFEQAPIGIAHSDRNARLLCVNERYATLLGHAATDLIGACWLDFLAPDDVGISLNEYQAFFDDAHTPSVFEGRYVRKDGTVVWANVTATVMRDSNGEAGYVIALVEDITAQKKAKEKLLMQSRLLECVEQAVIATDLNGRITFWNGVAEVMYGWTAEETLGAPVVEITAAPESDEQAAAILARLVRGESWMGEIVLARRDGSTFPALVVSSPMLDEAGKLIGVVGVSHDLTQQQNVQNELRAHKLQLAAAQEIARVGSWTYDFATGHRQWSEGLCRLTGLEPDARGSLDPIFDLIHPDDRARIRDLQRMSHDQLEPVSTEFRIVRGGAERTIMMRTRYVFGAQRQPLKIIGVVQDVTEEREREEELRRRTIQQSAVANLGQIALTGASIDFLLEQAASAVHLVLEVERSSIFRQDGEDLLLLAGEGWPARELRVARLAPTGEPLRDELFTGNGLHGGTTVPIYSADGTEWGILGVHTRQERVFAAHDVEFLRSIATLIGQAMDRALADLELTTRARQQSAIAKLGRLVLNALDTEVFDRACELLMLGAGVDFVFFNEVTSANTLRRRAGTVWSSDLPTEIPIAADTHAGQTLLTRQPIVVDDYATETRFRTYEATVPYGIRSGAMVPVTSGAQTFGVLSAQSRTPRHFRTDDVDFLETVANILAEAIERELARQVIEESEHRYRRIVDGATEIIFTIDAQGRLVALNAAFETITGWSRNEWLGRPFVDVIVPEDRERLQQLFTKMLTSARAAHTEMTLQGKDRRVHIDVSSFPKAEGGTVSEVYGFARDITETRRVTEERERVTRNLQLLLESTVEGIFTIDRAGRGTMVNRAAAAFLQRTPEELLGQPMHDLLHPCSTREQCSILRVLETGEQRYVQPRR
jgi:PAS domain S-box-containing protein